MLAYNCLQCYLVIIYLCFISYNFFSFIIYFGHFLNKADLTVNNLSLIKKKQLLKIFIFSIFVWSLIGFLPDFH